MCSALFSTSRTRRSCIGRQMQANLEKTRLLDRDDDVPRRAPPLFEDCTLKFNEILWYIVFHVLLARLFSVLCCRFHLFHSTYFVSSPYSETRWQLAAVASVHHFRSRPRKYRVSGGAEASRILDSSSSKDRTGRHRLPSLLHAAQ